MNPSWAATAISRRANGASSSTSHDAAAVAVGVSGAVLAARGGSTVPEAGSDGDADGSGDAQAARTTSTATARSIGVG
jgi:hypothetical protein